VFIGLSRGVLPKDSERGPLSLWSAAMSAEDQPQHGQTLQGRRVSSEAR
jgi:hypothetical protein